MWEVSRCASGSSPSCRATAVAASTVSAMQEALVIGTRMLLARTNVASGWLTSSTKTTAALASSAIAHMTVSRRNSRRNAGRACSSSVIG